MRELVIHKWCEFCWMDGEIKTPATQSWSLGMAEGETTHPSVKVLDVCDKHHAMMHVIYQAHAFSSVTPARSAPAPAAIPAKSKEPYVPTGPTMDCPVCQGVLGRGSIIGHVWTQHVGRARPDAPVVCPTCGEQYEQPTSCGAHRKAKHGYDPLAEALDQVPGFRAPRAIAKGA